MKPWHIAVVVIAALLLVGAAGAAKPVREPVDKLVFVHYKDAPLKPSSGGDPAAAFKLMGVKWSSRSLPVSYSVYTANSYVPEASVATEVQKAFSGWRASTVPVLFSFSGSTSVAPGDAPGNGRNEVYFGPIEEPNVIAVTTVWYYRFSKEIVEADIRMNAGMPWDVYEYGSGATYAGADAYDIRNIATHEAGHVCGLADLYTARSGDLTMYGYGAKGEVKKDTIEAGDIAGLQKLYGA
ncbi:MAG: matrixin family metalloprotease [Methanospirillum sp.]